MKTNVSYHSYNFLKKTICQACPNAPLDGLIFSCVSFLFELCFVFPSLEHQGFFLFSTTSITATLKCHESSSGIESVGLPNVTDNQVSLNTTNSSQLLQLSGGIADKSLANY